MTDLERRHYKRWCHILSVMVMCSTAFAAYAYDLKVDPMCRNVEAKYQKILLTEGEESADAVMEEHPNPAEGND